MKPTPKPLNIVCSVCDEPWDEHGDKPTIEDCIRLLKRHRVTPCPCPSPWIRPYYPWISTPTWYISQPYNSTTTNTTA